MILPDVNLLFYAHDPTSPHPDQSRSWWDSALSGTEMVGLAWVTLLGFIRITTNPTASPRPVPLEDALARVDAWLAQPNVRIVHPTEEHAQRLTGFLRIAGTAGNLTTDAHLAALAVEHGYTLYSADMDFGRFPGLSWRNPLAS